MVACEIDSEVSGEVLGWKLPSWQALLLHRVLPSIGGLSVYLTLITYDVTLIVEHYSSGHNGYGAFCIVLMVLPALVSLIFTLASPPPGLQTESSACVLTIQKNDIKWIAMQFVNCVFFPFAAIGRYCHQIFWWVEVIFSVRAEDKDRTKDALTNARAPSPLELYLFLQAFLHSAPHVILNILDLMANANDPVYDKVAVQGISVVISMMRMASTATLYRRFAREKISGRKYPWGSKEKEDLDDNIDDDNKDEDGKKDENIYEPILRKQTSITSDTNRSENEMKSEVRQLNANSDMIAFSPIEEKRAPWDDEYYSDSGTSSDFNPPEPVNRLSNSSDEHYVKPISIIDRVAPRRRDTQYTIEKVEIVPPPIMPAPRPMSLAMWAERMVENAEYFPTWISAPYRSKYGYGEKIVIPDEPELPRRVPRSYIRGLEPQDLTAGLVQYLGWYTFFVARLISMAAFLNCMPVVAIILIMSHYQIMLLFLIVPQASTVRRAFYIFLAFIYLFCLMEIKIRFRHVRVWHVFWIIVCTVEIIVFTSLWFSIGNNLGDWWKYFVLKVIFISLILSYMCFLVYFIMLKPRETVVYINKNNAIVNNTDERS